MSNNTRLVLPNSFKFKHHRVALAHPVTTMEQGPVPTLHAIGGMTLLELMVCHIAGGMQNHIPEHIVKRAKELLEECARVQGGGK